MSADPVCFLDSNIWLYALNRRQDEVKYQVARSLATRPGLWISTQVINEVCKNLIQKANFDEHQTTQIIIAFYNRCQVVVLSRATLLKASELRTRYQFSYWDSLILAAAFYLWDPLRTPAEIGPGDPLGRSGAR